MNNNPPDPLASKVNIPPTPPATSIASQVLTSTTPSTSTMQQILPANTEVGLPPKQEIIRPKIPNGDVTPAISNDLKVQED